MYNYFWLKHVRKFNDTGGDDDYGIDRIGGAQIVINILESIILILLHLTALFHSKVMSKTNDF